MSRRAVAAGLADLVLLLAFVAIGRSAHHHGESAAGLLSTWWPFATGLAVGWAAVRAWRRPSSIVPAGLAAWLGAVAGGMVLRVLAGQGTTAAFVGVALGFVGLFLLGWRLVVAGLQRAPRRPFVGASSSRRRRPAR